MHTVVRPTSRRFRRQVVVMASVAATVILVSGCAAPGSNGPATSGTAGPINTDASSISGVVDITLDATQVDTLRPITDAFTAEYPDITFNITGEDFAALQQNAPRLMSDNDTPDLIALPTPGNTVANGLVLNLDEYAAAYGWNDFPASQLDQWRFEEDGVRGSGSLYGMGLGFTLTGIYYNKDVAARAGVDEVPTTLEEFEAALEAAKGLGVTPLLTSGKDGLVFFPYQSLWLGQGTAAAATEWVFGVPDATIDTPEAVEAAATLQRWAQQGYLAADVNATDIATAQAQFTAGDGLYFSSGNWLAAPLGQTMSDTVGFFLFPAADGEPYAAMSDPANFVIPAKAENADAAAAFINWTFSDDGRQLVVQQKGLAPGGPADAAPVESDVPVVADAQVAFQELNADNGIVPFMGNATASFYASTLIPQLQLLIAGGVTPEQFASTLQADYTDQLGR